MLIDGDGVVGPKETLPAQVQNCRRPKEYKGGFYEGQILGV